MRLIRLIADFFLLLKESGPSSIIKLFIVFEEIKPPNLSLFSKTINSNGILLSIHNSLK